MDSIPPTIPPKAPRRTNKKRRWGKLMNSLLEEYNNTGSGKKPSPRIRKAPSQKQQQNQVKFKQAIKLANEYKSKGIPDFRKRAFSEVYRK